jgi:hypothetical protein
MAERDRWARSKRKQRDGDDVHAGHPRDSAWSPGVPSRPPPVPGLTLTLAAEPELTDPPTHVRIPESWNVTESFYGEAIAAGVTREGLDECVKYWRGRKLGGEWFSIEDFFRGKFASIRIREEQTRFASQQDRKSGPRAAPGSDIDTTGASSAFSPLSDHREFCALHRLDLAHAVDAYRKGTRPRKLGTPDQWLDFTNRLKCWAATGTFYADGPLPKPGPRATTSSPTGGKAVSA